MYVKWKLLLTMAIVLSSDAYKEQYQKKGKQCFMMLYH